MSEFNRRIMNAAAADESEQLAGSAKEIRPHMNELPLLIGVRQMCLQLSKSTDLKLKH